jgi:hypothetical protein
MENLKNKNREPFYRLPVPEDIMKAKGVAQTTIASKIFI